MVTHKQQLGTFGEKVVAKLCHCPRCKRMGSFKLLPVNFKCADVICDFCGFLAQVKTQTAPDINIPSKKILGAAWEPQEDRMKAGIYFPLYLVLFKNIKEFSVFYLSADLQVPEMFVPRKPLSEQAKRAGWRGYIIDLEAVKDKAIVRII